MNKNKMDIMSSSMVFSGISLYKQKNMQRKKVDRDRKIDEYGSGTNQFKIRKKIEEV